MMFLRIIKVLNIEVKDMNLLYPKIIIGLGFTLMIVCLTATGVSLAYKNDE
jgi:hypothetical protein